MGFAEQQRQLQVPYSPDDTFNALKAAMEKLPKVKVDSASPTTRTVAAEIVDALSKELERYPQVSQTIETLADSD